MSPIGLERGLWLLTDMIPSDTIQIQMTQKSIPNYFSFYFIFSYVTSCSSSGVPLESLHPSITSQETSNLKRSTFTFHGLLMLNIFLFLLFYHTKHFHFQQPYYVEHFHFLQLFLLKRRTLSPGIFLKKLHSSIAKHEIWNLEDWKVNIQNLFWHCGRFKYPIECNPMLCSQDAIYNHLWLCNM